MHFVKESFKKVFEKANPSTGKIACFYKAITSSGIRYTILMVFSSAHNFQAFRNELSQNTPLMPFSSLFDITTLLQNSVPKDMIEINDCTDNGTTITNKLISPQDMERLATRKIYIS